MTHIVELRIAADPAAWQQAGFDVDGQGRGRIGTVSLRIDPAFGRPGLRSWALLGARDGGTADVDGVPTEHVGAPLAPPSPTADAARGGIGALLIDHVVIGTPDLARTVDAVENSLGLPVLRIRDSDTYGAVMCQAFFRLGEVILEVVGGQEPDPQGGPARFYGIAVTVADLDAACAHLGPLVGAPKAAVQPGRHIATIRREAGLAARVALMSPEPTRP